MNSIRMIRKRLAVSQGELAQALGMTQGNISHYERDTNPYTMPPEKARRLIAYAAARGQAVTFDEIYAKAEA